MTSFPFSHDKCPCRVEDEHANADPYLCCHLEIFDAKWATHNVLARVHRILGPGDIAAETGCNLKNPPGRFIYFCAHPIDSNQVPQIPEFNTLFIGNSRMLRYKGL